MEPRLRQTERTVLWRKTTRRSASGGNPRGYEKARDGLKLREGVYLNLGGIFDWPGGPGGKQKKGCLGLRHHFGILSDGRVVPCCADFDGALALGNIKERPLAAILADPEALALRDSIAGKTPIPAYCASCGFTAPLTRQGGGELPAIYLCRPAYRASCCENFLTSAA